MPVSVLFINREKKAANALLPDGEESVREWDGLAAVDDTICEKMRITPHTKFAPYHDCVCFWAMGKVNEHSTHTMDEVPRDSELEIELGTRLVDLGPIYESEKISISPQELGAWILDKWEIQAYR